MDSSESPRPNGGGSFLPARLSAIANIGLLALAVPVVLYVGRDFLLPISLAFLLKYLFAPVVRGLKRLHIGDGWSAALILLALVGALVWGVSYLAEPTGQWIARAPETMRTIQHKLRPLRGPVEQVTRATEEVEEMTKVGEGAEKPTVEVSEPSDLGRSVLTRTWTFLANTVVVLILLYFLLASGDLFLRKLVNVLPTLEEKKRAVDIARQIEQDISAYLSTVTVINLVFGVLVGAAMWALGMPNPVLWGVLAAATNYLPYLGAIVCGGILTVVALLTFDSIGRALLVAGAFFLLNLGEAYFATPKLLGRRLTLNPVAIFLGVAFWGWIWGIVGALLAVPILAAVKILCDRIELLRPVGEFLGD